MIGRTILCLLSLVFGTVAFADTPFLITDNGQPAARIVTGPNPPESVAFAATELQHFIEQISGARLPIEQSAAPGKRNILLGPAAIDYLGPSALVGVDRDGYRISTDGNTLAIIGIDDRGPNTDIRSLLDQKITHDVAAWNFNRGTLYGVYRLLEHLGMRWYMPGPLGERAIPNKTLSFSGEIIENPAFITRTVSYWSLGRASVQFDKNWQSKITITPGEKAAIGFSAVDNRMWELRMRGESFRIPLNHNPPRTRWEARFRESNPEYFALTVDGSRDFHHLCYTNPGVTEQNILDAAAFAAGQDAHERGIQGDFPYNRNWHTDIALDNYFSVLPSDGFRQCLCESCSAKVVTDTKEANQRHSRLVWDFVRNVALGAPNANITCLAYGSYSIPYTGMEKLPDNVIVGFCAYSNPATLYANDNFQKLEELLERWAVLTNGRMAFWQHYLSSNRGEQTLGMPEHLPEMYARTIRLLSRYGNHAFCEMMADSIMFELFNRYLLLKLFYDPMLNEEELFRDFVLNFYGPDAGPLMAEIYEDIGQKSIERFTNQYSPYSVWERLYSEKTMQRYYALTDKAAELAKGTPYAQAVNAFREFYLGQMDRGRQRYSDPLGQLLASFNPTITSRPAGTTLTLGSPDDARFWQRAESVALGNTVNGKAAKYRTDVRSLYDNEYLYFRIRADYPGKPQNILAAPPAKDNIAFFVEAPRRGRGFCCVSVDTNGTITDYRYIDDILLADPNWKSNARAAVTMGDGEYIIDVAIPWQSLGVTPEEAAVLEIGALAARHQGNPPDPTEVMSTTSIILRGDPAQPGAFNLLKLSNR